jgi:hypothetical protein
MQMTLIEETKQNIELIKHTAAIHIKTNLSLVERKMINVLLKNAFVDLDSAKYHTIRLQEIRDAVGWKGKNYQSLKNSLNKLVSTKIEWNILGKDKKNIWATSAFLASASIVSGRCIYDYSYHLRQLFKNPNIYVKINLLIQNNFKSKYSLILWEFLTDHLSTGNKEEAQTDWIKIEDYKSLLGAEPTKYQPFKVLNANLIKAPIIEINKVSDLTIKAYYQESQGTTTAISFSIKRKPSHRKPKEELPLLQKAKEKAQEEDSQIQDNNLAKDLLETCCFTKGTIKNLLQEYSEAQLVENLKYIKAELAKGYVKNIPAYSTNAIKNDFRLTEKQEEQKTINITPKQQKPLKINNNHKEWKSVISQIKNSISEKEFKDFFANLSFVESLSKDGIMFIAAESKFIQNWIKREYQPQLEELTGKKFKIIFLEK